MKYYNLKKIKALFDRGENVTSYLKEFEGTTKNSLKSIEISYDLQAGSYIDFARSNPSQFKDSTDEAASVLSEYVSSGDRVLDCGTGEMTTLCGVAEKSFVDVAEIYCFDLSLSRLVFGKGFAKEELSSVLLNRLKPFIAELSNIPMLDNSMDIVWSSHALEPNYGREEEILTEIFRVAKKKVVLFEPSYERNTADGQKRMDKLGYIRGLEGYAERLGGVIEEVIEIKSTLNPLNPTYAHVITPPYSSISVGNTDHVYACPNTKTPLIQVRSEFFYSEESMLAYPIFMGIPVLRSDLAIVACHPDKYSELA